MYRRNSHLNAAKSTCIERWQNRGDAPAFTLPSLRDGDCEANSSKTVRNLGFIFDENATCSSHVSNICRAAFYALYRIGKIRHFLDRASTE